MRPDSNPYRDAARHRKARRIAEYLYAQRGAASLALGLTPDDIRSAGYVYASGTTAAWVYYYVANIIQRDILAAATATARKEG